MHEAYAAGKLGKADVHMHSTYSDGTGTIEEILAYTQDRTTLDVIAITDPSAAILPEEFISGPTCVSHGLSDDDQRACNSHAFFPKHRCSSP